MESRNQAYLLLSFLLFFSSRTYFCSAVDIISSGRSLTSEQTLISKGGNFELGFFTPGNYRYYIGIWYKKISVRTYVWVANRNTPLDDPARSELRLLEDGNLVVYNQLKVEVWSTNLTPNFINSSEAEAVLGDDGNLVLRSRGRPSHVYWQSFDYPSGTFLPGGKIRYDNISKKPQLLTSWENVNDPAEGLFSLELVPDEETFYIRWNGTRRYWSSGRWNGQIFSRVPEMRLNFIFNFSYVTNENESYFFYNVYNSSILSRLVMDLSGQIKQFTWNEITKQWFQFWSQPRQQCEVYMFCGAFSVCSKTSQPPCRCMQGFQPRLPGDWNMSDFSSGCVRITPLECGDKGTFKLLSNVRLPVHPHAPADLSADQCKSACLKNCSCSAYAYFRGCSVWNGDLSNLQQLSDGDTSGNDLYLKLAGSEMPNSGGKNGGTNTGIIVGAVAAAFVLGVTVSYIGLKKWPKRKGKININSQKLDSTLGSKEEEFELPLFELVTIATATNNFSVSNKIGQGGFGPVYKEIAIKRLSKNSVQGVEEFMNEVVLIAKLQHRNLVRLLGCCIEGEERMLIYEYMPNNSLDSFIFDKTQSSTLDWQKRFNIIIGITRGLLYLHHDSRLRIIHRDLKASNILLDGHMNPKISDFGMARIFGGDQTEENTKRVVGTYGYMSPEYATDGLFSMKSDVFSFGVLVLEIVSGKRNRLFHHDDHDFNLLGHAWKLLNEDKALELMDASIKDSATVLEVLKCIHVSLLCVQKFPKDRPTMSYVFSMLDGDGTKLPWPKQPGFYTERSFEKGSSLVQDKVFTANGVTVTLLEGR